MGNSFPMKLRLASLLLCLVCTASAAEDNLFKNSDVNTPTVWQGDRKFDKDGENKVLKLVARKNDTQKFFQEIGVGGAKDLVLVFRYKTADYKGRGVQLRGKRENGSSTFRNIDPKATGDWIEYRWDFSEIRDSKRMTFSIELQEGEGSVLFDDIRLLKKD